MISFPGAFGQLDGYKILCAEAREEADLLHLGGIVVPFRTFWLRKPVPIPLHWVFPVSFCGEKALLQLDNVSMLLYNQIL